MSLTHKTTLLNEANEAAVETYIQLMVNSHRDASKKREVIAYLKRLIETDKEALHEYQVKHRKATALVKKHSQRFDLTHQTFIQHLLTADARTLVQLMALLHVDNGLLYGVEYTFDNDNAAWTDSNTKFRIRGDSAILRGESNEKSAKNQELVCTCIVKAPLDFDPLDSAGVSNCTIKGVKFIPNSEEHTVTFSGKSFNLTFENCIFDGENHSGSMCFYGVDNHFDGALTIKNCIFKNYKSWLLMDPSTSSTLGVTKMSKVHISDCLFLDNMGSMAFRNVQDASNNGYSSSNADFFFLDNKIIVPNLSDVHTSYWSAVECNNFSSATVTGNEATCYRKVSGTRGFFQCWSRTPQIGLKVENNKLTNFNVGYQIAMGDTESTATFVGCPGVDANKYYIRVADEDHSQVDNTVSFVYPWDSSTAVVNLLSGSLPTVTAPSNAVVVPTNTWVTYAG